MRKLVWLGLLLVAAQCSSVDETPDASDDASTSDVAAETSADAASDVGASDAGPTKPAIGFNLGFVGDAFASDGSLRAPFQPAIVEAVADGFVDFRIQDPFSRGIYAKTTPDALVAAVDALVKLGARSVLFSVGDIPFVAPADAGSTDSYGNPTYTDRYAVQDADVPTYTSRMNALFAALAQANLLSKVRFELFNEPNAIDFFWGYPGDDPSARFPAFDAMVNLSYATFAGVNADDTMCCAFTSNLMGQGEPDAADPQKPFYDFMRADPRLAKSHFSFHWYPDDGIGPNAASFTVSQIGKSPMPPRSFVTEFNVDSAMTVNKRFGIDAGDASLPGYRARGEFAKKLDELYQWSVANAVAEIYVFKLENTDDEAGANGKIQLGLFDATGCPLLEYQQLVEYLGQTFATPTGCSAPQ